MAKAWKILNFNPDKELDICLPKILNLRLNEMLSYEQGMIAGKEIESLHNMRIASRRIQAVLKAFRDYYPGKEYRKEYVKLQSLIQALGIVRHFDVFINKLEIFRNEIPENGKDALELMIIRQKSLRAQKRKELLTTIRLLKKNKLNDTFRKFISDVR